MTEFALSPESDGTNAYRLQELIVESSLLNADTLLRSGLPPLDSDKCSYRSIEYYRSDAHESQRLTIGALSGQSLEISYVANTRNIREMPVELHVTNTSSGFNVSIEGTDGNPEHAVDELLRIIPTFQGNPASITLYAYGEK